MRSLVRVAVIFILSMRHYLDAYCVSPIALIPRKIQPRGGKKIGVNCDNILTQHLATSLCARVYQENLVVLLFCFFLFTQRHARLEKIKIEIKERISDGLTFLVAFFRGATQQRVFFLSQCLVLSEVAQLSCILTDEPRERAMYRS